MNSEPYEKTEMSLAKLSVVGLIMWAGLVSAQEADLSPTFGSDTILFNFNDDPLEIPIQAGGDSSISELVGSDCVGFVADAPDYSINYYANTSLNELGFYLDSEADTFILINTPDGEWVCNDAFDQQTSSKSGVVFTELESGRFDIWAGTTNKTDDYPDVDLIVSAQGPPWADSAGVSSIQQSAQPSNAPVTFEEYMVLAQLGQSGAQFEVGRRYLRGIDVAVDEFEGAAWLLRAAEQGHLEAQYEFALAQFESRELDDFYDNALRWAEQAANSGHTEAQYLTGVYYDGLSQETKDYPRAREWFLLAAEQGHLQAMHAIGMQYRGGLGVEINYDESMRWFFQAGNRGFALSQWAVGEQYFRGQGVGQDQSEAERWWRLSAEQLPSNALTLAEWYENGERLKEDLEESIFWYEIAAQQGNGFVSRIARESLVRIEDRQSALSIPPAEVSPVTEIVAANEDDPVGQEEPSRVIERLTPQSDEPPSPVDNQQVVEQPIESLDSDSVGERFSLADIAPDSLRLDSALAAIPEQGTDSFGFRMKQILHGLVATVMFLILASILWPAAAMVMSGAQNSEKNSGVMGWLIHPTAHIFKFGLAGTAAIFGRDNSNQYVARASDAILIAVVFKFAVLFLFLALLIGLITAPISIPYAYFNNMVYGGVPGESMSLIQEARASWGSRSTEDIARAEVDVLDLSINQRSTENFNAEGFQFFSVESIEATLDIRNFAIDPLIYGEIVCELTINYTNSVPSKLYFQEPIIRGNEQAIFGAASHEIELVLSEDSVMITNSPNTQIIGKNDLQCMFNGSYHTQSVLEQNPELPLSLDGDAASFNLVNRSENNIDRFTIACIVPIDTVEAYIRVRQIFSAGKDGAILPLRASRNYDSSFAILSSSDLEMSFSLESARECVVSSFSGT